MKNNSARRLYLFCSLFFLSMGLHANAHTIEIPLHFLNPVEVELTSEWKEYSFTDGVLIEYKMEKMRSEDYGREVNMVVFRFTNTTDQQKDCSWIVKIERDNVCYNCDFLGRTENIVQLKLDPKEVAEGDASNLITRSELNVFGNFVKLVPGMTDQKLTGFELINLTIK